MLRNVAKSFGGLRAVDDLSLTILPHQITAIIGPNGAGKTTLFNLCTGFLRADAGAIEFKGRSLTHLAPHRITPLGIARTFQDLRLIRQMTVLENVLLAAPGQCGEGVWCALTGGRSSREERANRSSAGEALAFVGLAEKADENAEALSYGQQKLLTIACCLSTGAEYILLDEPVAGIAPSMTEQILNHLLSLPALGKSVLFIEHNLAAVKAIAENVIVMNEGRMIAEGPWEQVSRQEHVLDAYLA